MMAVIAVCIVFSSLAWYEQGSLTVDTEPVGMSPDDPTFFTIGDVQTFQSMGNYKGQTGLAFYRYVETNEGDYTYIYEDDGIYEELATLDQILARANMYYFPYEKAKNEYLEGTAWVTDAQFYWFAPETNIVTLATNAQREAAKRIMIWDDDEDAYRLATFEEAQEGENLKYYDGETYTDATEDQILYRTHIYYGRMSMATANQLAAGLYLFYQGEDGLRAASPEQINAALRVLYQTSIEGDPLEYSIATLSQIVDRVGLFYGPSDANIATTEQLIEARQAIIDGGDNETIYRYNAADDSYRRINILELNEALLFYYKDNGVIKEKVFGVYNFAATKKQVGTYYWVKNVNTEGDYIASTIYKGEVEMQFGTNYSRGDTVYFEVRRQKNGTNVYTMYNSNMEDVFRNYGESSNCNITYPYGSSGHARINLEGISNWINLEIKTSQKTKDLETYDLRDNSGNVFELDNDKLANKLIVYSIDGNIRRQQFDSSADNQEVTFIKTAVTVSGTNYAGTVNCQKIINYREGTCRTVNYSEDGNYTASNSDYVLKREGTAGSYTYTISTNNSAHTLLFKSTDSDTTIEVRQQDITTYAIEDSSGMEDAVYSVGKQFNVSFPPSSYPHYIAVTADRIGIVPLHEDAANTLAAIEGSSSQEVYYTYVDDGTVDFGIDYTSYWESNSHQYVYVINYDGSKRTIINTNYYPYESATYGNLTYITSEGYLLYVEGESEDQYIQIHNGMSNMGTLTALRTAVANKTVTLYVKNGSRYVTYSERYGTIQYHTQTLNSNNLYYYGPYPVATNEQIAEGSNIYYHDGTTFVSATSDMLHASGLLYYSTDNVNYTIATNNQILAGNNLNYYNGSYYVVISKETVETYRRELYYHAPYPVDLVESRMMDENHYYRSDCIRRMYYWDSSTSTYVPINSDRYLEYQELFYSEDGLAFSVATEAQIAEGVNIYYDKSASFGATPENIATYHVDLYEFVYSEASPTQVERGADLYVRSVENEVRSTANNTLLYGEANNHTVSTNFRLMYFLPTTALFNDFYVEVDIYNVTDDLMLGTFYPDAEGRLLTGYDNDTPLIMEADEQEVAYRCVIRVYFMDGYSYNNLHSDVELTYSYQYNLSTPMYVVSDYGSLRPFTYSNDMYIGSNFLLRLNLVTEDIH